MADRVLRDHSEPCKHAPDDNDTDEDQRHYRYLTGHHRANGEWCPGGREVTIDYEFEVKDGRIVGGEGGAISACFDDGPFFDGPDGHWGVVPFSGGDEDVSAS